MLVQVSNLDAILPGILPGALIVFRKNQMIWINGFKYHPLG
mgnify:CR=1 FL=1